MSGARGAPGSGASPAAPATRPHRRAGSFRSALGWTALNALVPGSAFLATGRRVLGGVVLGLFLLLLAGGAWLVTSGQRSAVRAAVDTTSLLWFVAGVALVALLWAAVVVAGYRLVLPRGTSRGRRVAGAAVVLLLVAGVVVPAALAGQVAMVQRDLIAEVFTDDGRSATVQEDPELFGPEQRVNVLLLGGDGGEGRVGVRTDTVIVASIDTDDGETTLFSLPRNLEELPFPEDSPLADLYPDGFEAGSAIEGMLSAVYRNGPALHPGALGPTDNAGADWLKLGVGEALGLRIDYYVLVNLEGFSRLVDALGGITVDVNNWVPIGGEPSLGRLPDDYIAPGPDQLMDGDRALAFARGRFGLSDYDRMDRQRCAIDAIIDAADPVTLLRKYQQLARTTRDIVSTDIPRSALGDFVDLAFLVKDAGIDSVVFDDSVIDPADPDYDRIREIVDRALVPAGADADADAPAPGGDAAGEDPATDPGEPATGTAAPSAGDDATAAPVAPSDVRDACAYDREAAELALLEGEPATRGD